MPKQIKSNEEYMREIRNIQPAHPLVYERIEQILTEKDKELLKVREEERKRILTEIDRLGNFWTNNGAWKIPTDQEMADDSFKALKFGKVEILSDLKKFNQSELDQPNK